MKKTMLLASALVALLALDALLPGAIKAEIRVKAGIHTPILDVEMRAGREYPRAHAPGWKRPIHHRKIMVDPPVYRVPITKRDRKIAKRLSKMTGYRKRLLLDLRRDGLSWYRIAAILEVPPRLLRVAMRGGRHRPHYYEYGARHRPLPPQVCWGR
jgi:hypothetical protein